MKDFYVENLETTPSTFLSKVSSEIYLCRIVSYWDSIFTFYLTWEAFSVVCVLSVFFFLSSFFFYWYFPWQTLTTHRIAGKGEGIIIFRVSRFHPLTKIHLDLSGFRFIKISTTSFFITLFVITKLKAEETCSP